MQDERRQEWVKPEVIKISEDIRGGVLMGLAETFYSSMGATITMVGTTGS